MTIEIKDMGGHVEIFFNGLNVGFIKYSHSYHDEIGALKKGEIYSSLVNLHPAYRRRGIGTEAYKIFIKLMKNNGEKIIYAIPENPIGLRFMLQLGFKRLSRNKAERFDTEFAKTAGVYELRL